MNSTPSVQTYHCLCTNLLLATTHHVSQLARRQNPPSQDQAIILPLSDFPSGTTSTNNLDSAQITLSPVGYSTILGLNKDSKPVVIRKEDGFEKRALYRCQRCDVVVGYVVDDGNEKMRAMEDGVREVLFLLPGGLVSSKAMAEGKVLVESDVELVAGGRTAVAAWE